MQRTYLKVMLSLVKEAGEVALRLMDNSSPELKPDASVITKADKAISALAHQKLKSFIATGRHVLIDEEDPKKSGYQDDAFLDKTPFVWAIDPIDGTRAYANRMSHYGISLGLIKERMPWMGAVYFPSLQELFYCDGDKAYFIKDVFSWQEKRALITPRDEDISSRSVFITSDEIGEKFLWKSSDCRLMVFASAVSEFCWPTIGRGCGSLSRVHLWDFAGAWPIVEKAGLQFRHIDTGKVLDRLEAGLFHQDPSWKLKDYYILSSERNFKPMRDRITIVSK
ncbi:MAG: inositol monophosphatase family protein [Candidatus Omnitrophota bacterium]